MTRIRPLYTLAVSTHIYFCVMPQAYLFGISAFIYISQESLLYGDFIFLKFYICVIDNHYIEQKQQFENIYNINLYLILTYLSIT